MTEIDAARCPHADCGAVFESASRARRAPCPRCGRTVRLRWVRHEEALHRRAARAAPRSVPTCAGVYLLAEDVRSLWNVGSLFRSMDGLGGVHLYLCGITGIPPHAEIARTALGADEVVSWSYAIHPFEVIGDIPAVALEHTPHAIPLAQAPRPPRTLLIVGNEVDGVSPEVLEAVTTHVHIPMRGHKESLNVAVAAGIALWHYA